MTHQVELDVSTPSKLLPPKLLLGEFLTGPPRDNRQVGLVERVPARSNKVKYVASRRLLSLLALPPRARLMHERGGVEVVEKDAAYSSTFLSVGNEEVLVRPGLERRVVALAVLIASRLEGLVEVDGVLVEEVVGRQVSSSAEPADGLGRGVFGVGVDLEVAVVGVDGRCCEKGEGVCPSESGRVVRRKKATSRAYREG